MAMGILSLIVSIISLVPALWVAFLIFPSFFKGDWDYVAGSWGCSIGGAVFFLLLGVLGVIFGIFGKKDSSQKNIATGGLYCGIIASSLFLIIIILKLICEL